MQRRIHEAFKTPTMTKTSGADVRRRSARRATRLDRSMAPSKSCVTRLTRELKAFRANPPPLAPLVHVSEKDILDWFILIEGPPSSPYEGGWYVMRIKFKPSYPFEAPAVMMITPNGRFAENQSVCMSMTEWHQESWNPAWSATAITCGFLSFMTTNEQTSGGVKTTDEEKRTLAEKSLAWNAAQPGLLKKFPELASAEKMEALKMKQTTT
jgi:ubiquitin-conjugating enzyme E2 J2